jgi:hypothetical protein
MPPRLLPSVATASAGQTATVPDSSNPVSTTSDPPGSSVAERKLLTKSVPSPTGSVNAQPGPTMERRSRVPAQGLLTHSRSTRRRPLWCETRHSERDVVIPHKRVVTPDRAKAAPSLRVAPKMEPCRVARRLFGIANLRSSHLACPHFGGNASIQCVLTGLSFFQRV